VLDRGRKIIVAGVNQVKKHVRRGHPKSPQGGQLTVDLPIDSCKVMFYCGKCSRAVRLGYRYQDNGAKERYCKKCQASVGAIGPANPRRAKTV